jgi:hypothetical protein
MTSYHDIKVFSASLHMHLPYESSNSEMVHLFNSMSQMIISRCTIKGMSFLGHLKGVASSAKGDTIRFNQTDPNAQLDCVGHWEGRHDSCNLVINVLAFGTDAFDIELACRDAISYACKTYLIRGSIVLVKSDQQMSDQEKNGIQFSKIERKKASRMYIYRNMI